MISVDYANAYNEVLEILKYISKEDYNKIPKEQILLFETNANLNHKFTYNPLKTLDEQNALKITKGIIAILFRDYWATEKQRQKILLKEKYDMKLQEKEKKEKYNPDNIFNNKESKIVPIQNEQIVLQTSMVEYKESIFTRIKNWFKGLFGKK